MVLYVSDKDDLRVVNVRDKVLRTPPRLPVNILLTILEDEDALEGAGDTRPDVGGEDAKGGEDDRP